MKPQGADCSATDSGKQKAGTCFLCRSSSENILYTVVQPPQPWPQRGTSVCILPTSCVKLSKSLTSLSCFPTMPSSRNGGRDQLTPGKSPSTLHLTPQHLETRYPESQVGQHGSPPHHWRIPSRSTGGHGSGRRTSVPVGK